MTHREIAAVMGISRQRVFAIEMKALQKLRKYPENLRLLKELSRELQAIQAQKADADRGIAA